ncbi:MAG: hypothetical protein QNK04_11725 [Myxococcota bacterium]|nr:hypothetical protein [Myxococcota bacterium]
MLFAELLAGAIERTRVEPTPLATAYLVDLLDERVRPAGEKGDETLAEGLLRARREQGGNRLQRLRRVGDRALFVAGFFGDSFDRKVVGIAYYGDAGRLAYGELSLALRRRGRGEASVPELFEELADRFPDFVEVLTEVSDGTRAARPEGLAPLYARFLSRGEERDRRRLVRRGLAVPGGGTPRAQ